MRVEPLNQRSLWALGRKARPGAPLPQLLTVGLVDRLQRIAHAGEERSLLR